MKSVFLVALLFFGFVLQAQEFSKELLLTMHDEELLELFSKVSDDSLKAEIVARVYLNRARKENDTIKMARGYDRLARIFHPEKNIAFADSVIELTKDMNHKTYPALGYILKSYEYQKTNDLFLKTRNALLAYNLAVKNDNVSQQIYVSDYLIFLKSTWGNKRKALELQKKRHGQMTKGDYFKKIKESSRKEAFDYTVELHLENELSSIQNFVFCYLNLRELDSANMYLSNGLEMSKSYVGYSNDSYYYTQWFEAAAVEIEFFSGNFLNSIQKANSVLNHEKKNLSKSMIMNLVFFKGLSFTKLGEDDLGFKYLRQADSIFDTMEDIALQPDQRVLFKKLMEYSRVNGNIEGEIEYLNKLLFVDSIFKRNYQFFEPDIIKNFETPSLIREKEALINQLKIKNGKSQNILWIAFSVLLLSFLVIGYYFNRQLVYKRRFNDLIDQSLKKGSESLNPHKERSELSTKIIDTLMLNLDEFESRKQFLSQKISLTELSSVFNTNPRYLSKVINLQKDKSFPRYINDLRVDYALRELTENSKFRKYTIKAIAGDCGFKSAESFSKAFYKRHGIFPSYYIKKIESLNS